MPVSVEDIAGFFELAQSDGGIKGEDCLSQVFMKLADNVNPIALGRVKRARSQIQDLARKLLLMHMDNDEKIDKIIKALCSEAGSHDYTINRTEARKGLGLSIETPSMGLYKLINDIYEDFRDELQLDNPFNPAIELGAGPNKNYECVRALIESQDNGAYHLKKKGTLAAIQVAGPGQPPGQTGIQDKVKFDGWDFVQ